MIALLVLGSTVVCSKNKLNELVNESKQKNQELKEINNTQNNSEDENITSDLDVSYNPKVDGRIYPDVKIDAGRFVEYENDGTLKIKVFGVVEDKAVKSYQIGDNLAGKIDGSDIGKGDIVKVRFIYNDDSEPEVIDIVKY